MNQTATIDWKARTKFSRSHRKEKNASLEVLQIIDLDSPGWTLNGQTEANSNVDLRIYHTDRRATACLWIRSKHDEKSYSGYGANGSGDATGYGYHLGSQAAEEAITNAGVTLSKPIGGAGDSAVVEALFAIAADLGIKRPCLVKAHA